MNCDRMNLPPEITCTEREGWLLLEKPTRLNLMAVLGYVLWILLALGVWVLIQINVRHHHEWSSATRVTIDLLALLITGMNIGYVIRPLLEALGGRPALQARLRETEDELRLEYRAPLLQRLGFLFTLGFTGTLLLTDISRNNPIAMVIALLAISCLLALTPRFEWYEYVRLTRQGLWLEHRRLSRPIALSQVRAIQVERQWRRRQGERKERAVGLQVEREGTLQRKPLSAVEDAVVEATAQLLNERLREHQAEAAAGISSGLPTSAEEAS